PQHGWIGELAKVGPFRTSHASKVLVARAAYCHSIELRFSLCGKIDESLPVFVGPRASTERVRQNDGYVNGRCCNPGISYVSNGAHQIIKFRRSEFSEAERQL